jgi:hypothetical protein
MARRTLDIDDDTWRHLRMRAIADGATVSETAARAIATYVNPSLAAATAAPEAGRSIPAPMRETVRTVEDADLISARAIPLRHTNVSISNNRVRPVPKPSQAKPGAKRK